MDGQLRVELADLRGYADQVGRAGEACASLADYVATFVPDGDFGRILSLITPDYEHLVLRVRETLEADSHPVGEHTGGAAARGASATHVPTPGSPRGSGPAPRSPTTVGRSPPSTTSGTTAPPGPTCGGEVLPEVRSAGSLDQAARWSATSVVPTCAARSPTRGRRRGQGVAQARRGSTPALGGRPYVGNLPTARLPSRRPGKGPPPGVRGHADAWVGALGSQRDGLARVAAHLRDVIDQAVDVAQLVVDVVKEIISIVLAGLTLASIPIYGQVQLVDKVRDAVRLANDARKVLTVFWNFLLVVKDSFVLAADCFTAEALPPAPVRWSAPDGRPGGRGPRRAARGPRGAPAGPRRGACPAPYGRDGRPARPGPQRHARRRHAHPRRAGTGGGDHLGRGLRRHVAGRRPGRSHVARMAETHAPRLRGQVR